MGRLLGLRGAAPSEAAASTNGGGIGDPTAAAWSEEILTRAQELEALSAWVCAAGGRSDPSAGEFRNSIAEHLKAARLTAHHKNGGWWTRLRASSGGSSVERATGNLEAVEAHLLRLAPEDYVRGEMPSIKAYVCRYLPKNDPRRSRIESLTRGAEKRSLLPVEREAIVAAYHAASSQRRRELMRVAT